MTEFWGENLQFWERKNSELWEKSQCSEKKKCVRNFPIVGKKILNSEKKGKILNSERNVRILGKS